MKTNIFENQFVPLQRKKDESALYLKKFDSKIDLSNLHQKYENKNQPLFKIDFSKPKFKQLQVVNAPQNSLNDLFNTPQSKQFLSQLDISRSIESSKFNYNKKAMSQHLNTFRYSKSLDRDLLSNTKKYESAFRVNPKERYSNILNISQISNDVKLNRIRQNQNSLFDHTQKQSKYYDQYQSSLKLDSTYVDNINDQNFNQDNTLVLNNILQENFYDPQIEFQKFLNHKKQNMIEKLRRGSIFQNETSPQDEALIKEAIQLNEVMVTPKKDKLHKYHQQSNPLQRLIEQEDIFKVSLKQDEQKYGNMDQKKENEQLLNILENWAKSNNQMITKGKKTIDDYKKYQSYRKQNQNQNKQQQNDYEDEDLE